MIFDRKIWDPTNVLDITKLRLAWWVKSKWLDHNTSITNFIRAHSSALAPTSRKQTKSKVSWECPPIGWLKFNIDGAVRGCPSHLSIGGVLQDETGAVKLIFSKKVGWGDANLAEVLAVRKAMVLFATSSWVNSNNIIIESDSKNVFNPSKASWQLRQLIFQIHSLKNRVANGWLIRHISRSSNETADSLAKSGVVYLSPRLSVTSSNDINLVMEHCIKPLVYKDIKESSELQHSRTEITFTFVLAIWGRQPRNVWKLRPLGPLGWPVFGNIFDLGTMPHQTLYKLKPKYGLVLSLKLGSINTLVIQSAKIASELFKNDDQNIYDPHNYYQGTLALGKYGSYWCMDRCICSTKLLVNKRINEMAPLRQKCLDDMMRYIEEDIVAAHARGQISKVNLAHFLFLMQFNLVGNLVLSRDLLDSGSKKGQELFDAMNKVMEWAGKPILADFLLVLKWGSRGIWYGTWDKP
ncbi:Cytochrome P450 - like 10 [Theobroma cacao]|nr:Cytochrome P450 - like 10 [Theobroma cacao]